MVISKCLLMALIVTTTSIWGACSEKNSALGESNRHSFNETTNFNPLMNILLSGKYHKRLPALNDTKAGDTTTENVEEREQPKIRSKRFIILKILCHVFQWKKCARRPPPVPAPLPPPAIVPPPVPVPAPLPPPVIRGPFPPPVLVPGPLPPPVLIRGPFPPPMPIPGPYPPPKFIGGPPVPIPGPHPPPTFIGGPPVPIPGPHPPPTFIGGPPVPFAGAFPPAVPVPVG